MQRQDRRVIASKNVLLEYLYKKPLLTVDEVYNTLMEYKEMVAPFVCDVSAYLYNAIKEGKHILLEGQLGSMKDPDHGIYPMVTSSSTLAAYGAIGAGIPPYEIKQIVTVCKAYSSAVGAGEFVSEIFGEEADELRRRGGDGGEFGCNNRDVQDVWVGLTVSHLSMVVGFREQLMLHLPYWMYLVISMRFRFVSAMTLTER